MHGPFTIDPNQINPELVVEIRKKIFENEKAFVVALQKTLEPYLMEHKAEIGLAMEQTYLNMIQNAYGREYTKDFLIHLLNVAVMEAQLREVKAKNDATYIG